MLFRSIDVMIDGDANGFLQVTVKDNGAGRAKPAGAEKGLGLRGMEERVAALGGMLRIEAPAAGGVRLIATIPSRGNATPGST